MTKNQRIRELSDQLNELQLPSMAASLDALGSLPRSAGSYAG